MSSFKKGTFPKLITGLSIAAVLSISYGIYHEITYQPSYLDIQVNGSNHTVFGDIGEIGYYADSLVTEDQESKIHLVSWSNLNLKNDSRITVEYPSGKEEIWSPSVSLVEGSSQSLKDEYEIEEIYELEPYSFSESGVVSVTIGDDQEFSIDVK
ncbi:hypothetical protein J2Z82_001484 [Virgibacillus litoralis]|uniref:NusG domain-containing protein n=2 Tax=Virgibacillus litoralis TaxID=578221 RepID=A0ABS4HCG0_9BACI|nr:hypothetical protein [Virgibacillus litoralis]